MSSTRNLSAGPISSHLFALAWPMVFGIIAILSTFLVDAYFVGLLGTQELAALSFTLPVVFIVNSLAFGLGAGAASVLSRFVGANDRESAGRVATDSLVLALIMIVCIATVGSATVRPLFQLLGADGETLNLIARYMRIWFMAVPFLVVPMMAGAMIRALGDALWPGIQMIISAIVNIVTTPLLIFGYGPVPAMHIEGAAYGTFISWICTLIIAAWLVAVRERLIVWRIPKPDVLIASWRRILRVGIPAAGARLINPLGIAIVTAILAAFGDPTVAAFGVATRIESVAMIPMMALASAIAPIAGQNWGAGKPERVLQGLRQSYTFCFGWAAALGVVLYFFGEAAAGIFTSDPVVRKEAALYLMIVPPALWGVGWVTIGSAAYNAIDRPLRGLAYALARSAVLYVPLSFAAALLAGTTAVFAAIAAANALAGIVTAAHSIAWLRDAIENHGADGRLPSPTPDE
ncbi:MAG: MATE family efflux transporter [bacterium]|nr:MATE family efflux transporter [bacterium]